MAWAWHDRCESDTDDFVNQMGKTHSKPLAARHGRGTEWARHAMCEQAAKTTILDCVSVVIRAAATTNHFSLLNSGWELTLLINHAVMYIYLIPH